jgi:hypothetical protein
MSCIDDDLNPFDYESTGCPHEGCEGTVYWDVHHDGGGDGSIPNGLEHLLYAEPATGGCSEGHKVEDADPATVERLREQAVQADGGLGYVDYRYL